jgi:multiple sugar transport system substrate-binding protein
MKRKLTILLLLIFGVGLIIPSINVHAVVEQDVTVVISTGVQTTTTLTEMVADYNANEADGYTVELQESTWETQNQHDTYVTKLAAQDSSIDVISMDVIWPPEFTAAGWLEPLDDIMTQSVQDEFLEAPILAGTYQGKQYGMPWFHDSAMLYYRADILKYAADNGVIPRNGPPESWAELHDWTIDMLADDDLVAYFNGSDGILEGFVWQGREYEGMICNFMEYLGGTGKYTFLNDAGTAPDFDSANVKETLAYMKSLISDGASPQAVLTYQEETSRAVWNAGNAIFHRNWPYCYRLSLDQAFLNGSEGSYLGTSDKVFGVVPMPAKNASITEPRTSCLGGWQLGLNKYSEHKTEAKEFMIWLTAAEQQKTYLFGNGQLPTRKAVYSDAAVLADPSTAYIAELYDVFLAALPRPVHPDYPAMSKAIWPAMHSALSGGITVDEAAEEMNEEVDDILGGSVATDIPELAILAIFSVGTLVLIRRKKR